jgi:predicted nucleic acid-binding protein
MPVLIDSSVWIEYFRHGGNDALDFLIDENLIVINDIILTELIPFLRLRNQRKLIDLLLAIEKLELFADWPQISEYQYACLKNGLNGIGIPDLLIAQNARQHNAVVYSLDGHFRPLADVAGFTLFP